MSEGSLDDTLDYHGEKPCNYTQSCILRGELYSVPRLYAGASREAAKSRCKKSASLILSVFLQVVTGDMLLFLCLQ